MPPSPALTPPPAPVPRAGNSRLLILLVTLLLAASPLAYHALSRGGVDDALTVTSLPGGRIEYLADPSGAWSLTEVISAASQSHFQPLPRSADASPLRGQHWLRLQVPNPHSHAAAVVLESTNLYLDEAVLHLPHDLQTAAATPQRTGQRVPLAERSVRSHLPAFAVTLPADATTVFFIAHTGDLEVPSPVRLWPTPESFHRYEQRQLLPLALYFGVWAALFAYNAFIFAVLRDRVVLRYLGYLASVGGLVLIGTNFSAYFIPQPGGITREVSIFVLLALSCLTLVHFTRGFLATPETAPRIDRFFRVLLWLNGLALLASPTLFSLAVLLRVYLFYYLLAVTTLCALPLAGVYLWIHRNRQAPLYVIAFVSFGAGLVWMILAQISVLPEDTTNGGPFLIGSGLELLLLGIAVAHRYRLIRDEKEQLQTNYATQLEHDVADRTRELFDLSQNLTRANADKDRLISVIAHDVRAPLASLLAVSRALTPDQAAQHTASIQRRCTELLELVNNLLDWARLRTGQFPHEPAPLNLAGLTAGATRPHQLTATEKGLQLVLDIPADLEVTADGHAVQSILRNLVGNAVKFTPAGGTVSVRARRGDVPQIDIHISDTGVGIAPDRLAALQRLALAGSAPDTQGETGAGIGLSLVRELVDREGGSLHIESTPARGTTVTVRLPSSGSPEALSPA